jgi:carboxyl-terminal processing protease
VDNHRNSLKAQYPDFGQFKQQFEVPQSLLDTILQEGKKLGVKPHDEAEQLKTLPLLRMQLKALIARDLWDMTEYFQVMNETNDIVQKAVSLLND